MREGAQYTNGIETEPSRYMFCKRASRMTLAVWKLFVSRRVGLLMIERDAHFIEKNEEFYFKLQAERPT